jgi:hypothetical protein
MKSWHAARCFGLALISILGMHGGVRADQNSVSKAKGIDAVGIIVNGTALDGSNVTIGQSERGRPGIPAFDTVPPPNPNQFINASVRPVKVYNQTMQVTAATVAGGGAGTNVTTEGGHAELVAGVMISTQPATIGVSPGAKLVSSAYVNLGVDPGYQNALLSMQVVASNDARAVNLSWGKPLPDGGAHGDGSSLLARGLDWLSVNQKVGGIGNDSPNTGNNLYVIILHNTGVTLPTPKDSYNGIVVGATATNAAGVFNKLATFNNYVTSPVTSTGASRPAVDIVAPGAGIMTTNINNTTMTVNGTSFAAPLVTGTVALLQQAANLSLKGMGLADSSRSEVMKAILMNSADRFTSNNAASLGMEKTITYSNGTTTWLTTHANETFTAPGGVAQMSRFANDPMSPLDAQMGTGQLNASQAVREMLAGRQHAAANVSATVGLVGWDFSNTNGTRSTAAGGNVEKYVFNQAFAAKSWVQITLDDQRIITKATAGGINNNNRPFAAGDQFTDHGFEELNLYLLPRGANNVSQAVWGSTTTVDSIQSLFFQIATAGNYEFWVFDTGVNSVAAAARATDYGIAWRASVPEPSSVTLMAIGVAIVVFRASRKRARRTIAIHQSG